jgi:hypothetical protein
VIEKDTNNNSVEDIKNIQDEDDKNPNDVPIDNT